MMKNKNKSKKIVLILITSIMFLLSVFLILNIWEYNSYNKNFNQKLSSIILTLKREYPNISEKEIMKVLYTNNEKNYFDKYNIDIKKDTILKNNYIHLKRNLIINSTFYLITIFILIFIFIKYNNKNNEEINKITKCIEKINKKIYELNIDDMKENQLSILKNEIYKTTIMLKEDAETSKKEKLELKESLSDISHQLKTPLTSILIALDNLIDDSSMDEEVRKDFIKDIKREITNISFLVQSILKLSKLDTNTVEFNREKIKINDILIQVKKNLSMLCDLKEIDIVINNKDNPVICCDMKWQIEALTNIVKNSIEHSQIKSKIIINVKHNNLYSELEIKDNGKGIDKDDLPHIFERFYKGKNASVDSIGIGLALSKNIIEKDNGKIIVDSTNNGTTFKIKYFY